MIEERIAMRIFVHGVVQGVGFRPYVESLAVKLKLSGTVKNQGGIVEIEAAGTFKAMDAFIHRLKTQQPSGAHITQIQTESLPMTDDFPASGFLIIPSGAFDQGLSLLPPDLPMCEQCKTELYDPQNRRYQHPFISCVACGPRYSIIQSLPYDRCNITMDPFPMCPACSHEYKGLDRRRHAQTISCLDCGPQLILNVNGQVFHRDIALNKSIELLQQGKILAIKNIGGYHFACLPTHETAVDQLRQLKGREKKPFAVMFNQLEDIHSYCIATRIEVELLTSPPRPIVLLETQPSDAKTFCRSVGGDSRYLGAFLPSTALQDLLTKACGPLVMTSGNLTGSPIMIRDAEMLNLNSPLLSGVLYNHREILTPLDDSVMQVVCGQPQLIRRSRGFVPSPLCLSIETPADQPILATGSDLKSVFCLMSHNLAYLSQYFGNLDDYTVYGSYLEGLRHIEHLFGISPAVIACDLHPGYRSAELAYQLAHQHNLPLFPIQHHHAHIASVMAEHHLSGKVLGVAFDGTGYGTDGAVWGGEFLLCEDYEFTREAHLGYTLLCGGDAAVYDASLSALGYLFAAGLEANQDDRFSMIRAAIEQGINSERSSSMGRLFDAISSLLGLKHHNDFEAECAIALENAAAAALTAGTPAYPLKFEILHNANVDLTLPPLQIDARPLIHDIIAARNKGVDPGALALGFHNAVADMVLWVCNQINTRQHFNQIALSGGVFANHILLSRCLLLLQTAGYQVYINRQVPTNDGGISLGQAYICTHLIKRS